MQDWNPFETADQQPSVEEAAVGAPAIQIHSGDGEASQLLSTAERRELARIARIRRHVDAGAKLFEAGTAAHAIFNIVSGVAKKSEILVDGRQPIVGFFFAHDLLGVPSAVVSKTVKLARLIRVIGGVEFCRLFRACPQLSQMVVAAR